MHIPHPFAYAGLVVNMAASFLLLWYPPMLDPYTAAGRRTVDWVRAPTTAGKHRSELAKRGYSLGMSLLVLGFFLQLLDLLTTP